MDLTPIVVVAALVAAGGLGRALTTLGRAGDVMASLFVPPDRALGWPHGVQEQDAPWGWGAPGPSAENDDPAGPVATERISGSPIQGGSALRA